MKKILSLFIAFIMLFDLTTPIFAVAANNKEEQKLFTELTDSLEEEHQKQEDINTKLLASCLQKNNKNLCSAYLKNINELFSDTRDKIEKGKQPKEEAEPTPISQREYEKQLEDNTPLEYDKAFNFIKDSFEKEKDALALKYKGISQNTQEYANYQLEMDNLEKWRKNNIENLDSWRKEVFDNKDTYYQNYLKEFDRSKKEFDAENEQVRNEFFKELADNIMKVYDKLYDTDLDIVKQRFLNIMVMLLSMETPQTRFFTSEQRSKIFNFLNSFISVKDNNPCRYRTRAREGHELKDFYKYVKNKNQLESSRRNTLSVRDQTAKQAAPYEDIITNELTSPITELVDENSCKMAFSALDGLMFFKGWNMGNVVLFMLKNTTEPIASHILLMGSKVLINTERIDLFETLQLGLIKQEKDFSDVNDRTMQESWFFDTKFYKQPYIFARYSDLDGGGDAYQDMAEMLSNENTKMSENVQHKILDNSIFFNYGTNKFYFTNNTPFVYGLLLHNPKIIDTFVPTFDNQFPEDTSYIYEGKHVFVQYFDDYIDIYIKDAQKGAISLSDDKTIKQFVGVGGNYDTKKVGEFKKETLENYLKRKKFIKEKYDELIKKKGRSLSSIYAEAFYNTDFSDLNVEEVLALDTALEQVYPYLKQFSSQQREKLEKHRKNYELASGIITIIDIGLTLWCVADIYKLAKWGVKTFKAVRAYIIAGRISASLSTARKIAFFRTAIAKNPDILTVHRRIKNIKSISSRITNKFPVFNREVALTRLSFDGQRTLNVVKLDGTPVTVARNSTPKAPPITKPTIPSGYKSNNMPTYGILDDIRNKVAMALISFSTIFSPSVYASIIKTATQQAGKKAVIEVVEQGTKRAVVEVAGEGARVGGEIAGQGTRTTSEILGQTERSLANQEIKQGSETVIKQADDFWIPEKAPTTQTASKTSPIEGVARKGGTPPSTPLKPHPTEGGVGPKPKELQPVPEKAPTSGAGSGEPPIKPTEQPAMASTPVKGEEPIPQATRPAEPVADKPTNTSTPVKGEEPISPVERPTGPSAQQPLESSTTRATNTNRPHEFNPENPPKSTTTISTKAGKPIETSQLTNKNKQEAVSNLVKNSEELQKEIATIKQPGNLEEIVNTVNRNTKKRLVPFEEGQAGIPREIDAHINSMSNGVYRTYADLERAMLNNDQEAWKFFKTVLETDKYDVQLGILHIPGVGTKPLLAPAHKIVANMSLDDFIACFTTNAEKTGVLGRFIEILNTHEFDPVYYGRLLKGDIGAIVNRGNGEYLVIYDIVGEAITTNAGRQIVRSNYLMGIIKYDKDLDAYTLITNYQVSKGKLYSELTGKITYLRQPSVKTALNKTFVKTFKEDMDGVYWNNYH